MAYIALSHCWGKAVNLRLLPENFKDMQKSIVLSRLTKNFRDAVIITRGLRIRYLWIDSLCIIQGDKEDWKNEASRMGLVYAMAKCVISATASEDSHGGCFYPKTAWAGGCHLCQEKDTSLDVTLSDQPDLAIEELFKQLVEDAPVNKRAWCFQERILATRVLHFCDGVVLFECNTKQSSSSHGYSQEWPKNPYLAADGKLQVPLGPMPPPRPPFPSMAAIERFNITYNGDSDFSFENLPDFPSLELAERLRKAWNGYYRYFSWRPQRTLGAPRSARLGMRGAFELLTRFAGSTLEEKMECHYAWYQLVERYSVGGITVSSDKLIAIEGIVQVIRKNSCLHALAGLWVETLAFNLLWLVKRDAVPRPKRVVPTWSWASVDGHISHLLRAKTTPKTGSTWKEKDMEIYISYDKRELQNAQDDGERILSLRGCLFESCPSEVKSIADIAKPVGPTNAANSATPANPADTTKPADSADTVEYVDDWPPTRELLWLPILSFRNRYVEPGTGKRQLHGIVVTVLPSSDRLDRNRPAVAQPSERQSIDSTTRLLTADGLGQNQLDCKRVGYFWTEEVNAWRDRSRVAQSILLH